MRHKNILFLLLIVITGCNVQNGDNLGDLFGRWKLISISQGDHLQTCDSIYYSFQHKTALFQRLEKNHTTIDYAGTFVDSDTTLLLNIKDGGKKYYNIFLLPDTLTVFQKRFVGKNKLNLTYQNKTWHFDRW